MSNQPDNHTTIETQIDGTILLHNPAAPAHMQPTEAGRLVTKNGSVGFKPVPFATWALSARVLRAIADLVDEATEIEADQ